MDFFQDFLFKLLDDDMCRSFSTLKTLFVLFYLELVELLGPVNLCLIKKSGGSKMATGTEPQTV
jgi:hypothetical protein